MRVLIIGANRGIGLALVEKYINEGHEVLATCRKSSPELEKSGAKVFENIEVTDEKSLQDFANQVSNIDIFIHSAGILTGDSFSNVAFSDVQKQFEINALAPLKSVKAFHEKINEGGKIGLVSSRMGSIADNTSGGQYGYRASKSALNSIGKSLAQDLKESNKAVFILHPGYVRTDMTNNNGLINADESAQGLYEIMQNKTIEQTGSFWHTNGEELPW